MMQPYRKIQVLLADDHEVVRDGLESMLGKIPEIEILAIVKNGEELVSLTRRYRPDVILTDVRMPKLNGVEAARLIKINFPIWGLLRFPPLMKLT